ncbi:HopJ type III effector protein [Zhouia amylolytica]|uniref:Type III effector HopPmaJ n=1 Tax=Zhouia amylolytica AD3 TaxID=1286632 RepID=W2UMS9_9FLAO|nr:HopJ type III effector protein [Zhouia amylolytica]ETN94761.1 type III effector HopPmaJ [Zhouia amylolytica AD3]
MELKAFIEQLSNHPSAIEFIDTMAVIDAHYSFTPTEFKNGDILNEANQNNGSCKIFAFAQLNQLSKEATLACFGKFYTEEVLEDPEGDGHQNIRNFMKYGWDGIQFKGEALISK